MKTFFLVLFGGAVVIYAVLMLCGMVMGEAGLWVAGLLVLGAVLALLACVLEKLDRVEQKLDRLIEHLPEENKTGEE